MRAGDVVTVPCGMAVKVDVDNIPTLRALVIEGLLYFPHDDGMQKVVRTGSLLVKGYLWMGQSNGGMTGGATVTFELT